jgi:nitrate reductase NapAB chaperone NapD
MSKCGGKLTVTFEQVKDLYQTLMALNGLMGVMMVDMMLHMVAKVDEDKTGWRKKELLQRTQALYDDAVKFYGWQS